MNKSNDLPKFLSLQEKKKKKQLMGCKIAKIEGDAYSDQNNF